MDFIVKRFNSLFSIAISAIIILGIMFLFAKLFFPVLIIGLVIWMFLKVVKTLKSFSGKKDNVITSMNDAEVHSNVDSNEFTNGEIIDVDYKEL